MAKGNGFAVITMKKQTGAAGGLSAHIDREIWDEENQCMVPFRPASVRNDARAVLNRECIESSQKIGRTQAIWRRLNDAGFSRKKEDNGDVGKKTRKIKADAVIALCFVCTSDEESMKRIEAEDRLEEWIDATLDWFRKEFGTENVVSAVLHMDETTPHLHITVVPITTAETKVRKEKPKFDENGKPIRKYVTDKEGNIILDAKGRATPVKRAYKKKEVTARLSAKDIATPISMDRWQDEYPKAVERFGLKRGIKGSKLKNVPPAEYNLAKIKEQTEEAQQQLEAAVTAKEEVLKEKENAIKDTKDIIKECSDKKEQLTTEVEHIQHTIDLKSDELQQVNTVIEQQSSVLEGMRAEKKELEDAIVEKKQEQERMNKETWLDTMKGLVNKSDKDKKYLAEIERLEKENLAVYPNGKPVLYKSGNQASWPRYAELLHKQIQEEKEKSKTAVEDAINAENIKHQQKVNELNKSITDLKNQVKEKNTLIEKLRKEKEALRKRLSEVKEAFLNVLCGPKFRAAVNSIVERFNFDQTRFTDTQKGRIEDCMSGEKTIDNRKALGKDAVEVARIVTDDKEEWKYIPKEVDEIAEKKWEESQALLREAAEAVVRVSETPGKKYFNSDEKEAIDAYLNTDAGRIEDIWEEARGRIGNWADFAKRTLYNYAEGIGQVRQIHI